MLIEDIKSYNKEITDRGLIYLIGFSVVLFIGIIKDTLITVLKVIRGVMVCFYELFYERKKRAKNSYNGFLFTKPHEPCAHVHFSKIPHQDLEYIGFINSLDIKDEDYYKTQDTYIDLYENERNKISSSSQLLRDYLLTHDSCLNGEILKVEYPKIPLEELGSAPVYLVQHITFGEDLNSALSYLFRIDIKKVRKTKETYLVINNNGTIELEEKLKEFLMDNNIKIKLVDKNKIKR